MEPMSPMLQAKLQEQPMNTPNYNNVQYAKLEQQPDSFESSAQKETKSKTSGLLKFVGIVAAIAAVSAIVTSFMKKGKAIKLSDMTPDRFKEIKDNGFTGKIRGKLKNGDKVVIEYKDGLLSKSKRSGNVNFEKVYNYVDGKLQVSEIIK